MRMGAWNIGFVGLAFGFWLASGTQRERCVLAAPPPPALVPLEVSVASHAADAQTTRDLAQAYLDARLPGFAISLIEQAALPVRTDPIVAHAYARALLGQGRAADALSAERRVLATCERGGRTRCDAWMIVSATRRADILQQLVELGIEDAEAHPEESAIAYHNATREMRLALQ